MIARILPRERGNEKGNEERARQILCQQGAGILRPPLHTWSVICIRITADGNRRRCADRDQVKGICHVAHRQAQLISRGQRSSSGWSPQGMREVKPESATSHPCIIRACRWLRCGWQILPVVSAGVLCAGHNLYLGCLRRCSDLDRLGDLLRSKRSSRRHKQYRNTSGERTTFVDLYAISASYLSSTVF